LRLYDEDIANLRTLGNFGAELLPQEGTILTHCNAGALAACGYGSALGVIRAAIEHGKKIDVFADETRPFNQGARLTAWELMKDGIPTTIICDNMAGHFMFKGRIQAVIVGADRIAANGDTANKIGTYSVAILAREHGIPSTSPHRSTPSTPRPHRETSSPSSSAARARSPTSMAARSPLTESH